MSKVREKAAKAVAFKWAGGFRAAGVSADAAAAVLQSLPAVTAEAVLDVARDETSPLHPLFEWDDGVAAEAYRRQQARNMIRCVVRVEERYVPEHREFTLVGGEGRYERTTMVVGRADLYADAIGKLAANVTEAVRSVKELESVANAQSADATRMSMIALAAKSLEAASKAIQALH